MNENPIFGPEENEVIYQLIEERNALHDEVAELKRKLAEAEGARDALRDLLAWLQKK